MTGTRYAVTRGDLLHCDCHPVYRDSIEAAQLDYHMLRTHAGNCFLESRIVAIQDGAFRELTDEEIEAADKFDERLPLPSYELHEFDSPLDGSDRANPHLVETAINKREETIRHNLEIIEKLREVIGEKEKVILTLQNQVGRLAAKRQAAEEARQAEDNFRQIMDGMLGHVDQELQIRDPAIKDDIKPAEPES